MSEIFIPREDEANCAGCVAEWVLDGIYPGIKWWHLFWNPEPKPHLTRFLAIADGRYLCETHYRKFRMKRAIKEAQEEITA